MEGEVNSEMAYCAVAFSDDGWQYMFTEVN